MRKSRSIQDGSPAALRSEFMERHAIPLVRRCFAADPLVQSVVLAVAQYWDDEADDAVHTEFIPCTSRDPVWPGCARDPEFFQLTDEECDELRQAWPDWPGTNDDLRAEESDGWPNRRADALVGDFVRGRLPDLDPLAAVAAFAAYCDTGSTQEMALADAYTPYAIFRRGDPDPLVEVVGRVLQPQWENRGGRSEA